MKLLLEENLSPRLTARLADDYPGTSQVELLGRRGSTDTEIWELAKTEGCLLVSKDNDFRQRSFQFGAPPKVVWLNVGNAGSTAILHLLLHARVEIERFAADPDAAFLMLSLREPS